MKFIVAACIFVRYLRKKRSCPRLNALLTVLFLLSSGVALVNLWDVKPPPTATAPRRRKRWRSAGSARELDIVSGKYVSSGLFVMLHLSLANGWPFKTPRCHFVHFVGWPFFFSFWKRERLISRKFACVFMRFAKRFLLDPLRMA